MISLLLSYFLLLNPVHAYQLQIDCDGEGNLTGFKNLSSQLSTCSSISISKKLEATTKLNSPSSRLCSPKNDIPRPNDLGLFTEYNSKATNRRSKQYDRKKIQEIIDVAVANQIDPYAALSIVIMERPPLNTNDFENYSLFYGIIPIDNVAGADVFRCQIASTPDELGKAKKVTNEEVKEARETFLKVGKNMGAMPAEFHNLDKTDPEKYAQLRCFVQSPKCRGIQYQNSEKRPEFDLTNGLSAGNKRNTYACSTDRAIYGGVNFSADVTENPPAGACCAKILVEESNQNSAEIAEKLQTRAALEYIRKKVQNDDIKVDKANKTVLLAHMLQRYNGRGKYGVTENLKSNCLSGMNMAKTPVYGSITSDIILNMLLVNPEISTMIENSLNTQKQKLQSVLCQAYGKGTHLVDSKKPVDLQKKYLSKRKDCLKGNPVPTFDDWNSTAEAMAGVY